MYALQIIRRQTTNSSSLQSQPQRKGSNNGSKWRWLPLALALVGWSTATTAAEYAIQVGAFKSPTQTFAENLRSYGEVNTSQSSSGITIFTVGRYGSVDEAKGDLNRIAADYPGAFVRNMPSAAGSVDVASMASGASTAATRKVATQQRKKSPDTQLWDSLSDSERRRVVYLDGVLHLKQGDQFVPLDEYRRNQAR